MRILVACEYSGIVSQAFRSKGHRVTSCDLLPSESPGAHYRGDVTGLLRSQIYDLLIAFPPCTWLAQCQMHRKDFHSQIQTLAAFNFVHTLWNAPVKHIAIENPVGWLNTNWRPPDQITSPHFFGSPYSKPVCLWLKNLPPLMYGAQSPGRKKVSNHVNSRMPQSLKGKIKSKFFPEVAAAMAAQWSEEYLSQDHPP